MAHSSEWLLPGSAGPFLLMLALAACGDGGAGTLAYVETECRDTKELGFVERQALRIDGDRLKRLARSAPAARSAGRTKRHLLGARQRHGSAPPRTAQSAAFL
jgi:hypothetical protein